MEDCKNRGQVWLTVLSALCLIAFIACTAVCIKLGQFTYLYFTGIVALAIEALGVYKFVSYRDKCHALDVDIENAKARLKDENKKTVDKPSEYSKQEQVTTDSIIKCLKDIGYAPKCDKSDDGTYWISVVYGDITLFVAVYGNIVQVVAPFNWDDEMKNPSKIHNFLLAANATMTEKRFVQITGNVDGCRFTISGFVTTCAEAYDILPVYFRAINESIDMHRYLYNSYMQEDKAQPQQQFTNKNTVN